MTMDDQNEDFSEIIESLRKLSKELTELEQVLAEFSHHPSMSCQCRNCLSARN